MNAFNRLFILTIFCGILGRRVEPDAYTSDGIAIMQSVLNCLFRPIDTKNFSYALSSIPGALKQHLAFGFLS